MRPLAKKKKTAKTCSSSSLWADLHPSLLHLILDHLPLLDQLHFSLVCRPWRALSLTRPVTVPLLMLPPDDPGAKTRTLYSPFDGTYHDVPLPDSSNKLCLASSHGWLLFADPYSHERFLLHPFSNARIDLPPWPFGSIPVNATVGISLPPTDPGCVAVFMFDSCFVYCTIGDAAWSTVAISCRWPMVVDCDAVACDGRLHVVSPCRKLGVVDVFNGVPSLSWLDLDDSDVRRVWPDVHKRWYVVEAAGRILLVFKDKNTWFPKVFMADMGEMAWLEVEGFRDLALFLGNGGSFSVSNAGRVGQGNRIHFALRRCGSPIEEERRFMVVYNMDGEHGHASWLLQSTWAKFSVLDTDNFGWEPPHWLLASTII
ncbi:putative F-box/kelch-repeat protein [Cocos nucifera]|uniref:Putative F-box/kelch-repeat protein n=1 Tax=Cocos nucifera TaxID=13894 RepID=A0A8K0IFS1_COCNU|nr:putative F-box/kelch-repeat protein [Cocos nucifera]